MLCYSVLLSVPFHFKCWRSERLHLCVDTALAGHRISTISCSASHPRRLRRRTTSSNLFLAMSYFHDFARSATTLRSVSACPELQKNQRSGKSGRKYQYYLCDTVKPREGAILPANPHSHKARHWGKFAWPCQRPSVTLRHCSSASSPNSGCPRMQSAAFFALLDALVASVLSPCCDARNG